MLRNKQECDLKQVSPTVFPSSPPHLDGLIVGLMLCMMNEKWEVSIWAVRFPGESLISHVINYC